MSKKDGDNNKKPKEQTLVKVLIPFTAKNYAMCRNTHEVNEVTVSFRPYSVRASALLSTSLSNAQFLMVNGIRNSPLIGLDLDFSRQQDYPRADWTGNFVEALLEGGADDAKEFDDWNQTVLTKFDEEGW